MLSKRERKARHLATAAYLEQAFPSEHEVVEVLASHYVAAYEAVPGDDDAAQIQQRARELLSRAGERSASLAASEEARHYFEQAAAFTEDRLEQARLLERAGEMALRAGDSERAQSRLEEALSLLTELGEAVLKDLPASLHHDGVLGAPAVHRLHRGNQDQLQTVMRPVGEGDWSVPGRNSRARSPTPT